MQNTRRGRLVGPESCVHAIHNFARMHLITWSRTQFHATLIPVAFQTGNRSHDTSQQASCWHTKLHNTTAIIGQSGVSSDAVYRLNAAVCVPKMERDSPAHVNCCLPYGLSVHRPYRMHQFLISRSVNAAVSASMANASVYCILEIISSMSTHICVVSSIWLQACGHMYWSSYAGNNVDYEKLLSRSIV